jgi:PAS domain S-box-containing protein
MVSPSANHETHVILDSINEGVFTVDPNWHITSFNRAAEKITGIKQADALGRSCCDVFHADICQKACALRRTFDTERPIENATAHIFNNQGRKVPIRLSTAILKDHRGRIIGGVETFQDLSRIEQLQKELENRYSYEDIVGRSSLMMRLFQALPQISDSSSTVLIEGPSGTGKELFARAIHNLSPRRKKRFVAINCAALPDSLLESELFGYKAGAFTDARRDKNGLFSVADGGTIFLDEIGDISAAMQVRLLRVLQNRVIQPLGGEREIAVDIRVVAATNKQLFDLVQRENFREDLYYRIRVIHMTLPDLKSRREDIPLLIDHFIRKMNRLQGKDIAGVSMEVTARLMAYDFPGNIRELENILEHAFVLCRGGIIELHHLPTELQPRITALNPTGEATDLKTMEKHLIALALQRHFGNRKRAARDLGIDVATLYRKIKSLNIEPPATDGRCRSNFQTATVPKTLTKQESR